MVGMWQLHLSKQLKQLDAGAFDGAAEAEKEYGSWQTAEGDVMLDSAMARKPSIFMHFISRTLLGRARITSNNCNEADCLSPPWHSPTFWIINDALRVVTRPFLFCSMELCHCCNAALFTCPLRHRLWRKSAMLCLQRHLLLLRRTSRQNVWERPQKCKFPLNPCLNLCMC